MEAIYILDANIPMMWGDYGAVLAHGMTERTGDGRLELSRAGPFVPPITLPFDAIIVTDTFRKELEASGLKGLTFRPVIKKHIVRIDWEKWDWNADDPAEYPSESEPENYISDKPHSPETASKLGNLWEAVLEKRAETAREKTGPGVMDQKIFLKLARWDGRDFFMAEGVGYVYVTEKAKNWLETKASEWVSFRPAEIGERNR